MLAAAQTHEIPSGADENQLLEWFAQTGAPMSENILRMGELRYFQFSSGFSTKSGRVCGAFGRSQDRKIAALKCAAEYVERKTMLDFFSSPQTESLPPPHFHTSNGWAAHFNKEEAVQRSYLEALERHLLLLSYLNFGWRGFSLVQRVESENIDLYFLQSRFSAGGFVAGLVAAKSPYYSGLSFGYCVGEEQNVTTAKFWESALFESIDRILTLNGEKMDLSEDQGSWLRQEAKFYLETPFDLSLLKNEFVSPIPLEPPKYNSLVLDVSAQYKIPAPFYAAYSWGQDMIPLFHKAAMDSSEKEYLRQILLKHGLSLEIPERHPAL